MLAAQDATRHRISTSPCHIRGCARHKSQVRSKSVAARLPPGERTVSPASSRSTTRTAVAAAASAASAAPDASSEPEFPPKEYKEEVMKLAAEGIKKFLKFMPALPKSRQMEWDLPLLLSRCDALYETLDPSIRLIPSRPQNLLQRKKTLACNLAFSVCPYIDVNGKKERFEFNRLFGAARNGPDRLTEQFVPDSVKAHVQKMKKKANAKAGKDVEMGGE